MKYVLGIDVGTSNVKAVIFDAFGKELQIVSQESETFNGKGNTVEQDMTAVWERVKYCVKGVMAAGLVPKEDILGIGVCGQGEGCWLIDKEGNPVQNAILWCDGRAADLVNTINEKEPDLAKYYYETTGVQPLLGNQMVLLRWMKENRKEILDAADKLLFCKDWIRYKLTGNIGADLTDSMTSLLDVQTGQISDELLKKMGVYEYRDYLPTPHRPDEVAGCVRDELADELGLRRGTPVIYGALDTSATAVGLGAIHESEACVILGTTCACEINMKKEDCQFGAENTRYERHPVGELFVELQPTLNGTPNIDWMLENIAETTDFNEIDRLIESVPVGCGGVIYLPYISVAGERSPFFHPYARAEFFGISTPTTRNHLIRAIYEGLSFSVRDCLLHVDKSGTIFLAGGGAKSPVWAQMIADVMGMKVMIPSGQELGSKGVAMMVGVSQGLYKDYDEAVEKACSFTQIYEPDPVRAKKYDLIFELYLKLRRSNDELWNQRHALNKQLALIK